ncbi:efflux transporter outer membrane subunit [Pseudomonas sp. 273]|uniref:efflux transporter outer membrane subunit n=1 Tax=Pseudomonas sp. 273 TaxID=75692 RepID=UPI0023D82D09|nr:efflux transporter outer membrane subunit [Pseudomonas sp. 273]
MKHAPLLLACLALGACTLGPDFRRPDAQAPAAWNAKGDDVASRPADGAVESRWWRLFDDPQLDRLQARVAAGNLDLQAAAARLEQSRAIRQALGADAVPQVDSNAGYARQRNSEVGLSDPSGEGGRHNFNQLDAGFTLSWELDLWGRVRRELEAAEAKAQVAVIESQLPGSQKRQARLLNALAYLLGEEPGALAGELAQARPIPRPPQAVPVGLPAELARRRPDIRQAEAVLHAATASIGVARADFYPRISLNGDFGFQALQLANFGDWNSRTFGIGPSLHLPIFEGGRLKGTLALREAQQQEAAIAYRRTVLNAWREVDDALNDYAADQRELAALDEAVEHGRTALANAREQYKAGAVDFLNVLSAQRELLASEERQVRSSEAVGVNLALLYKALGGGWQEPNGS